MFCDATKTSGNIWRYLYCVHCMIRVYMAFFKVLLGFTQVQIFPGKIWDTAVVICAFYWGTSWVVALFAIVADKVDSLVMSGGPHFIDTGGNFAIYHTQIVWLPGISILQKWPYPQGLWARSVLSSLCCAFHCFDTLLYPSFIRPTILLPSHSGLTDTRCIAVIYPFSCVIHERPIQFFSLFLGLWSTSSNLWQNLLGYFFLFYIPYYQL